jgi:hypothetical protein
MATELLAGCTRTFKGRFDFLQQLPFDAKGKSVDDTMEGSADGGDSEATNSKREDMFMCVQSRPETDAAGQSWLTTEKPMEQCRWAMAAGKDRILIVCDVSKHLGAKTYGSIRDPSAMQDYITRRQKTGVDDLNLYKGLTEGLPTKLFADIDLRTASRVEGDFERYKRHMDEVREYLPGGRVGHSAQEHLV